FGGGELDYGAGGFGLNGGFFEHRLYQFQRRRVQDFGEAGKNEALLLDGGMGIEDGFEGFHAPGIRELNGFFLYGEAHTAADRQGAEVFLRQGAGELEQVGQQLGVG